MADAYSRMSGKVGVVTTHQGCGLSNAITGIGEAAKSRTPLIVLTADTPAAAIRSNFKIDQDALANVAPLSSTCPLTCKTQRRRIWLAMLRFRNDPGSGLMPLPWKNLWA